MATCPALMYVTHVFVLLVESLVLYFLNSPTPTLEFFKGFS